MFLKDKFSVNQKDRQEKRVAEQLAAKEAYKLQLKQNEKTMGLAGGAINKDEKLPGNKLTDMLIGSEEIEFQRT